LIDSTSISLCLSFFAWAKYRTAIGGLKIQTAWNDELGLPDMINLSEANLHYRCGLANNVFEKDAFIVEDKEYFDFSLMMA